MSVASDGSCRRANCGASLKRKPFAEINAGPGSVVVTIVDIDFFSKKVRGKIGNVDIN
jgi:hypothetical protein